MSKDLICAFIMTGIIVFFGLQLSGFSDDQSIIVPKFIICFMAVINFLQYMRTFYRYRKHIIDKLSLTGYPIKRVSILCILTVLYIALLEIMGFYLASFLYLACASLIAQPMQITPGGVVKRTVISFLCVAFLYLLFTIGLAVQIPKGFLNI